MPILIYIIQILMEWVSKLKWIMKLTKEERKETAIKNLSFANQNFSNEAIDVTWKNIF